jgi:S1-C subfamily serine protease
MEKTNQDLNYLALISEQISGMVAKITESIVEIHARERIPSTGLNLGDGYIVTASHTIKRTQDITVRFGKDTNTTAELIGRDAGRDLAVLKLPISGPSGIEIADTAQLKTGHLVVAAGFGHGKSPNASLGMIKAIDGPWRTWRGGRIDQLIHPDLILYPGFSGGPLLNSYGQVLGINTSALWRNQVVTIPMSTVNRVVSELKTKGRIPKGYLGVAMYPLRLPRAVQEQFKLTESSGLIVLNVEPQSPANQAGLLIGDLLVKLNDTALNSMEDIQAALEPESVGKTMKLSVVRGGAPLELSIVIGERPH